MDVAQRYHQDALVQLRKYKELAERAVAQLPPAACFTALDAESYSIALIMKHMAGNMRSRWTDFLSTDGEKPRRGSSPHDIHHVLGRAALYRNVQDTPRRSPVACGALLIAAEVHLRPIFFPSSRRRRRLIRRARVFLFNHYVAEYGRRCPPGSTRTGSRPYRCCTDWHEISAAVRLERRTRAYSGTRIVSVACRHTGAQPRPLGRCLV